MNDNNKQNFKENIIKNTIIKLQEMIEFIKKIKEQIENLKNNIPIYIYQSILLIKDLETSIDNYKSSLDGSIKFKVIIESKKEQKLFEEVKDFSQKFISQSFCIYENEFIKNIKDLSEKFENCIEDIEPFQPPNINYLSSNNISINLDSDNIKSYEEDFSKKSQREILPDYLEDDNLNDDEVEEEEKEEEENIILICSLCKENRAYNFCKDCNKLFCKKCDSDLVKNKKWNKHNIVKINESNKYKDNIKIFFINSLNNIIKSLIMKCNYLISKEKINKNIRRKINFPYIKEENDNNSKIDFLNNINNILKEEFNGINLDVHYFYISEINKKILRKIKDIFIDEKINLIKDAIEIMAFGEDSSEDEYEYQNEAYNKDGFKKYEKEFDDNKNMFYYVITLVSQRDNIVFNKSNIKTVLIKKLGDLLQIEKNNIFLSFNNKYNFINSYIKTKEFNSYSLKKIQENYPGFEKLYEYKIIFDNILKNEKYKEYLDYRGNTVCPNSSFNLMRGTEEYNPPYGWFGIGLKVMGKYEKDDDWLENKTNSSKWAIAYYSVGQYCSSNKINEIINNIITKDELNQGKNQFKCSSCDKRHPGKRVGVGIYLTPDINIAEKLSGKMLINGKKYRIILMARVLISQIKEPTDINFWIINDKKYIRFYRILVKEVF